MNTPENNASPTQQTSAPTPKKWKLLLVSWLFVYPVINIMFVLVFPMIKDWPQLLKTLVFTVILVPLMGYFIPLLHKKYWKWLTT